MWFLLNNWHSFRILGMRPSLITQTSCKDIRRQALKDSPLPIRLIPAFVWHLLCRKETANTEELEVLSVLFLHHVMSESHLIALSPFPHLKRGRAVSKLQGINMWGRVAQAWHRAILWVCRVILPTALHQDTNLWPWPCTCKEKISHSKSRISKDLTYQQGKIATY